jgi:hypothetical protein
MRIPPPARIPLPHAFVRGAILVGRLATARRVRPGATSRNWELLRAALAQVTRTPERGLQLTFWSARTARAILWRRPAAMGPLTVNAVRGINSVPLDAKSVHKGPSKWQQEIRHARNAKLALSQAHTAPRVRRLALLAHL